MAVVRTETWNCLVEWGVSTVVVEVHSGEKVRVADKVAEELGLDELHARPFVDGFKERFSAEYPYFEVAAALNRNGYVLNRDAGA